MEVGLGGQSQASARRPQAIKINETWANNEGLFVKAKLQNKCLALNSATLFCITGIMK
jgi:hypothetical protein